MPIYVYRCGEGHVAEKILLVRERETPGPCPTCGGDLQRVYLTRAEDAQRFRPIVIHESADGEFSFPMHPDAPVPPGFTKREITTFVEADTVLKRVNARERDRIDQFMIERREQLNEIERRNRSDLLAAIKTDRGRAFAKLVMAIHDRMPRPRAFDGNVYLDVRENGSSNREAYRDQATGWRGRRA